MWIDVRKKKWLVKTERNSLERLDIGVTKKDGLLWREMAPENNWTSDWNEKMVGRNENASLKRLDIGLSQKRWPLRIIGHLVGRKKLARKRIIRHFAKKKILYRKKGKKSC